MPWRPSDGATSNGNLPDGAALYQRPVGSAARPGSDLPRRPTGGSTSSGGQPWATRPDPAQPCPGNLRADSPATAASHMGDAARPGKGALPGSPSSPAARTGTRDQPRRWCSAQQGGIRAEMEERRWREMEKTVNWDAPL